MLIKVFSVVEQASSRGVLEGGGGSNRLPGLVTKQQAVEFLQVQTSNYNNNKQESYVIKLIGVYKDSKLLNSDRN